MKTIIIICLLSISISLGTIALAFAGGDPTRGKSKAIICIGCHGVDGNNSNPEYPVLAGQGEGYIAKQLSDFKAGVRVEEHMSSMVEALNLADIPDVASYFSQQHRQADTLTNPAANKDQGKLIFLNGIAEKSVTPCAACHALDGMGNAAAKFPALAGQHSAYITKMLNEFRSGLRHNDATKMMQNIAANLSDQEINALSVYISGMKVP